MEFELTAPSRGLAAEIRLKAAAGRWVALARWDGHESTGLGPSPRGALVASLAPLGTAAVSELLADLCLLDVSRQLIEAIAV
jgi:hypothetical protein